MEKCVITACDKNYEENVILDFFSTLRNDSKFTGVVVLIDYGCTPDALVEIKKYTNFIIPAQPPQNDWNIAYALKGEIVLEIVEICKQCDCFLLADSGDIWFQKPLDGLWEIAANGIAATPEVWYCNDAWFDGKTAKLPEYEQHRIRQVTNGKIMRNAGCFAGDRESFKIFVKSWTRHIRETSAFQFGLDQIYFNYLMYTMPLNFIDLPRTYNYIAQAFPFKLNGNVMLNADTNEVIHIGHNAGSRPVPRIYNGVDINKKNKFNF